MADSTMRDVDKTTRTLNLRKKILDGHKMSPTKDQKVWGQMIKLQTNNLTASIEKCDLIIKALEKLQKAVKVCSDELESEIVSLRKALEANNTKLK
jgi:lysyl-tRNA synthetase class II